MEYFLADQEGLAAGATINLNEAESRHCVKVLRHVVGDVIHIVDGRGGLFEATILQADFKACMVQLEQQLPEPQQRGFHLTIATALPKNNARFEWLLEKTTEIGVDRIIPIHTQRSEKRKVNTDRFRKILIAAMKQSGKARVPELWPLVSWKEFLANTDSESLKCIAVCFGNPKPLQHVYDKGRNVVICIGPEGDFTQQEAEQAVDRGFVPVSLGQSRLRLETAGMVACHTINMLNE